MSLMSVFYSVSCVDYIIFLVTAFYFFFFQAEDGIRDTSVTGVQTCALPICTSDTNHSEHAKMDTRRVKPGTPPPQRQQPPQERTPIPDNPMRRVDKGIKQMMYGSSFGTSTTPTDRKSVV